MSNDKVWIPPGMRVCTWDEAKPMNEDGGLREGVAQGTTVSKPYAKGDARHGITWICIDAKPQHTHDKPWVKLGFEECGYAEAPKDPEGLCVAWGDREDGGFNLSANGESADYTFLRPSPLVGLKRALAILGEHHPDRWMLEAEIAKYEPPVCGECGRVK